MKAANNIQMIRTPSYGGQGNRIPNEVVGATMDGLTPIQAWREHLGLTQAVVAQRLGISQVLYAKYEKTLRPRTSTISRIAVALGISKEQLDF
ncbi:helix-turn-helix transcriptional regulator [Herbaspirillum sp.]|uniref:helix-turn-helix domain-containing protein n=1 Tax=Herbaspirillum sp. TaxID=1890675 RepID=UPI0031D4B213